VLSLQHYFPLLLLHGFFHTDGVGRQFQVAQNLWLAAFDIAFDCRVSQQRPGAIWLLHQRYPAFQR